MHVTISSFYSTKWLHVRIDSRSSIQLMFSFGICHVFIKSIEKLPNSYWILVFQLTHAFCNLSRMNSECYLNLYLLLSASDLITNHLRSPSQYPRQRAANSFLRTRTELQKHELKHDNIDHQNPKQGI